MPQRRTLPSRTQPKVTPQLHSCARNRRCTKRRTAAWINAVPPANNHAGLGAARFPVATASSSTIIPPQAITSGSSNRNCKVGSERHDDRGLSTPPTLSTPRPHATHILTPPFFLFLPNHEPHVSSP